MPQYRTVESKRLILSLVITLSVMFLEIIGGLLVNSIALISDAGHMFTHAFAISISLFAIYLVKKPPCHHRTYGLYRAEVLAAFVNGLFLLVIVGFIIYEAFLRLLNPVTINSIYMFYLAIIGLAVNLASILILHASKESSLNIKGVFVHMIGDAASSVGIVAVSVIIFYTNWYFLDPLVSFGIAIAIIIWAIGVLKDSTRILLEMAPEGLNVHVIEEDLRKDFKEITDIFDSHLWTITSEILVFSTHLRLREGINQDEFLPLLNDYLFDEYNIFETTIQVTYSDIVKSCKIYLEP